MSGRTPVWALVLGGLFILVGVWVLIQGLSCASVTSSIPGGSGSLFSGLSGVCTTYEWGGAFLLILGLVLIVVPAVASSGKRRRR